MKTFLFTWSHTSHGWPYEELKKLVQRFALDGDTLEEWNCKSYRQVKTGDRVFLMKQGDDSRGLFGSGRIVRDPYPDLRKTYKNGSHPYDVDISFDFLSDPVQCDVLISLSKLNSISKERGLWHSQFSGKEIPADVAQELENLWAKKIASPPKMHVTEELLLVGPPSRRNDHKPEPGPRFGIARQDQDNKMLGNAGELAVPQYEKNRLMKAGRKDLADMIVLVANTEGDSAGYDIRSYEEDGTEIHIEVKTTNGGINTPFFISRNELEYAKANSSRYRLYRVYGYSKAKKVFILRYPLEDRAQVEPHIYRVRF